MLKAAKIQRKEKKFGFDWHLPPSPQTLAVSQEISPRAPGVLTELCLLSPGRWHETTVAVVAFLTKSPVVALAMRQIQA